MARYGKPLRRVVLEYDDETRTLEGEKAEQWMDAINGRMIFCALHPASGEFPHFEWTVTPAEKTEGGDNDCSGTLR